MKKQCGTISPVIRLSLTVGALLLGLAWGLGYLATEGTSGDLEQTLCAPPIMACMVCAWWNLLAFVQPRVLRLVSRCRQQV